jgi:hypothetical protein
MLEGIRGNDIIVGGYTDGAGGVCPMLAAHRAGGRTSVLYFAKAWERVAEADTRTRRATERELLILTTHLEASLLYEAGPSPDLAQAVAEHRDLIARRGEQLDGPDKPRPGDPDRSRELRHRPGWAWMRVFRRFDDYERALERLQTQHRAGEAERERETVG